MKSPSKPAGNIPYSVKSITLMGVLGALLILVQVGLAVLPNIELVSLLIILYALVFSKHAFIPVFVFILVEGLIYGFGLWWLNYLYVWPLLVVVALLLNKQRNRVFWVIVSAAYGLSFGALCAIPYLFIGGLPSAFAYWVQGIPFDFESGRLFRAWIFKKGEEDRAIGMFGFSNIVRGAFLSCFLGYKLDGQETCKGYMTEALDRGITVMFEEYGLHRIEANIMPKNKASLHVVEKLGFLNEGLSRQYLKINGIWEDHIHMVLLNDKV